MSLPRVLKVFKKKTSHNYWVQYFWPNPYAQGVSLAEGFFTDKKRPDFYLFAWEKCCSKVIFLDRMQYTTCCTAFALANLAILSAETICAFFLL